jgi:hypothetical protein
VWTAVNKVAALAGDERLADRCRKQLAGGKQSDA